MTDLASKEHVFLPSGYSFVRLLFVFCLLSLSLSLSLSVVRFFSFLFFALKILVCTFQGWRMEKLSNYKVKRVKRVKG